MAMTLSASPGYVKGGKKVSSIKKMMKMREKPSCGSRRAARKK